MYYFDSFGVETPPLFLEEYFDLGSNERIKQYDEPFCGAYCLYMIYLIDRGFRINNALNILLNQCKYPGIYNECFCLGCSKDLRSSFTNNENVNVNQGTCFADDNVNDNNDLRSSFANNDNDNDLRSSFANNDNDLRNRFANNNVNDEIVYRRSSYNQGNSYNQRSSPNLRISYNPRSSYNQGIYHPLEII